MAICLSTCCHSEIQSVVKREHWIRTLTHSHKHTYTYISAQTQAHTWLGLTLLDLSLHSAVPGDRDRLRAAVGLCRVIFVRYVFFYPPAAAFQNKLPLKKVVSSSVEYIYRAAAFQNKLGLKYSRVLRLADWWNYIRYWIQLQTARYHASSLQKWSILKSHTTLLAEFLPSAFRKPPLPGPWQNRSLSTNSWMCSKYVSQKRNEAIDNWKWYNITKFVIVIQKTLE